MTMCLHCITALIEYAGKFAEVLAANIKGIIKLDRRVFYGVFCIALWGQDLSIANPNHCRATTSNTPGSWPHFSHGPTL